MGDHMKDSATSEDMNQDRDPVCGMTVAPGKNLASDYPILN